MLYWLIVCLHTWSLFSLCSERSELTIHWFDAVVRVTGKASILLQQCQKVHFGEPTSPWVTLEKSAGWYQKFKPLVVLWFMIRHVTLTRLDRCSRLAIFASASVCSALEAFLFMCYVNLFYLLTVFCIMYRQTQQTQISLKHLIKTLWLWLWTCWVALLKV